MTFQPAVSKGITITFGSYFTDIPVEDITLPDIKADAPLKTTNQLTTDGYHTYIPAGFTEPGEVSFKIQCDVTAIPPVNTADTLTVAFPTPISKTHTYSDAIFVEAPLGAGPLGQLFTGTLKFKLSGQPTIA